MKTLILFAGKHGAAGEIARRIAQRIDGAAIHDLKQSHVPALDPFDCVILGGSLYAGAIRKEARTFLSQNSDELQGKKIGLFLSGMDASQESTYFDVNFPPELLRCAKAKSFLGGIFDPEKVGALERLIMRMATKHSTYTDNIDDEAIARFAEEMKG